MHFIKSTALSLCIASLAACTSVNEDLTRRGWPDSSDLAKRQAAPAAAGANGERLVQIVTVGDTNGSLKFFPDSIRADVGSVVQFQFYPKNHTITESSFADPCKPIASNLTSATRPGQKSGFVPVSVDTQFRPVYNMIVNDTKPMWVFCGQMPHCQKGMSMVINQNMTDPLKTLEKYKAAAAALPVPSASGAAPPAAGVSTTAVTTSAATVTAASTTSAAGPSLAGTVTSAAPQSGSSSAAIGTFTGGASPGRHVPGVGLGVVAAGAFYALL